MTTHRTCGPLVVARQRLPVAFLEERLTKQLLLEAQLFVVERGEVVPRPGCAGPPVHDVHLNEDDHRIDGPKDGDKRLRKIESRVRPKRCVACNHGVDLKLGAAEYVSKEVAPDCIRADTGSALLDYVRPNLVGVLDETASARHDGCEAHKRQAECITFESESSKKLEEGRRQERTKNDRDCSASRWQAVVTGVDVSLDESDQTEAEGGRCKCHVCRTDSAGIRVNIYDPNGLVKKKECEARESNEAVVSRVPLCALVVIIDHALLAQSGGEEQGVRDAEKPRSQLQAGVISVARTVGLVVWQMHFQCIV